MADVELTFLYLSDGQTQSEKHKAAINAHVAKHSHRERRAAQLPLSPARVKRDSWHESRKPQASVHRNPCIPLCLRCKQAKSAPSLLARLCGNSDPFSSLPISIDAEANYYLSVGCHELGTISRDLGDYPDYSIHRGQLQLKIAAESEAHTFKNLDGRDLFGGQLNLERLADLPSEWTTALVYSVLAYCANALSRVAVAQHHSLRALRYSAEALKGLRKCIEMSEQSDMQIEELVYRLFRADFVVGNYTNAKIHLAFLHSLLHKKTETGVFDIEALLLAVHDDNALSFATMSRPMFRSIWLSNICANFWEQLDVLCPTNNFCFLRYLAPTLELQDIMITANILFKQSDILRERQTQWTRDNWYWIVSRRLYLQNRMIDYYVALAFRDKGPVRQDERSPDLDNLLERSLLLAVYMAQIVQMTNVNVGKTPMIPATKRLYLSLDEAFAALELNANKAWFRAHIYPVIWICFVTALLEHKHRHQNYLVTKISWYKRLCGFIQEADLRSWLELQTILEMFPYSEGTSPLPHVDWLGDAFVRTVSGTLESASL